MLYWNPYLGRSVNFGMPRRSGIHYRRTSRRATFLHGVCTVLGESEGTSDLGARIVFAIYANWENREDHC